MIRRRRTDRVELLPAAAIDALRADLRRERRAGDDLLSLVPALSLPELDRLHEIMTGWVGLDGPLTLSAEEATWWRRVSRRVRLRLRFGLASLDEDAQLLEVSLGAGGVIAELPVVAVSEHRAGPVTCVAGEWGCFCLDATLEVPHAVRGGRAAVLEEAIRWHGLLMSGRSWREAMGRAARRLEVEQAVSALDPLPRLEQEARERKAQAAGEPQGTKSVRPESDDEMGRSDSKAAALVGVGRSTVVAAREPGPLGPRSRPIGPVPTESQAAEVSEPAGVEVDVNGNPVAFGPAAFAEDMSGRPEPGSAAWVREYEF